MILIGLTGGIGSGKTTVAKAFLALGVPIYISDDEAKKLMGKSKVIKRQLVKLFGDQAYISNQLNKSFIADIIFKNKDYLAKMNAIVHPKVEQHFNKWVAKQNTPYIIKESAILFENGGYKECDYVITVIASKSLRMKRLLLRDNSTKAKIEAIMKNQWQDEEKIKLSDFVIENKALENTKNQVLNTHQQILELIGKS